MQILDIIGNNPQISLTLAPHCVWCSAGVTQIQIIQEKNRRKSAPSADKSVNRRYYR
jgi:hypothetical protein